MRNYSKLKKLVTNPKLFFEDAVINGLVKKRKVERIRSKNDLSETKNFKRMFMGNEEAIELFNLKCVDELNTNVDSTCKYIAIPWIESHGDRLVNMINERKKVIFFLNIFKDISKKGQRSKVINFARLYGDQYRKILLKTLSPLRGKISGVVVTMDWTPPIRQIVYVCKELGIKTVLVPHESVFADKSMYYTDVVNGANYPIADKILVWGKIQRDIFEERGYPKNQITVVGSPKLDNYINYEPNLSKRLFHNLYGLDCDKKTIMFAAQPLDSQFDTKRARSVQRDIIKDLFTFSNKYGVQVIVRGPPSGDQILNGALRKMIASSDLLASDTYPFYLSAPEDAIKNVDVITSINSTMLFEASLAGKPAISTKYLEFNSIWENLGIPFSKSYQDLEHHLHEALQAEADLVSPQGWSWAKESFSPGLFDGKSIDRIVTELEAGAGIDDQESLDRCHTIADILDGYGTLSLHNNIDVKTQFVPAMLGYSTIISAKNLDQAFIVDLFSKWGISDTPSKSKQDSFSRLTGRKQIIIEDGFLRSVDIGLSGSSTLSIIIDDLTAYYDATKPSRLEKRINSSDFLTEKEFLRARDCILLIKKYKLSKYNHAPVIPNFNIGNRNHKVLLIDQRYGDMSVEKGMANEKTFSDMLLTALHENPNSDILIKRHPDAVKGGKESYFSNARVKFTEHMSNVYLIDYDVNPHCLFDIVDKVYVVTSGMGFEALMAGCKVEVFGAPFYSGWGCTNDRLNISRRLARRSKEEIFHFSYIEACRYVNPITESLGQIEDVIDYLHQEMISNKLIYKHMT